jgi:GxxExxY protein
MDTAELDRISYLVIQAGIEIHKTLGPGLLESVYRRCMIYELQARDLEVNSQLNVPIRYKHLVLDGCCQLDLLVNDAVVVELKAVETVRPVVPELRTGGPRSRTSFDAQPQRRRKFNLYWAARQNVP